MYICQNGSKHAAISSKYTADPVSCSHLSLFVLPMADHVVVRHSALMRTAVSKLRLCTLLGLGRVQHRAKKIWLNPCTYSNNDIFFKTFPYLGHLFPKENIRNLLNLSK